MKNKPAPFSINQKHFFDGCFHSWFNVAEGGKRGGKNVISTVAFCAMLEDHPNKIHLIAGVSLSAAKLNIVDCDGFGMLNYFSGRCHEGKYKDRNCLYVNTRTGLKIVLISGGGKDGDEKLIKGNTYGMAYITEANECCPKFIQEVFDRTLSSFNRKIIHDLNPKTPLHWYYTDVLAHHENAQKLNKNYGYNYGHFTIADNMSITNTKLSEVLQTYDKKSVWYKRDILGLRQVAKGVIYSMFDQTENVYKTAPVGALYSSTRTISIDYGTTNPCVFLDVYDDGEIIRVDREYTWDSRKELRQKTDEEYANDFIEFMGDEHCVAIVDPSAASFIAALKSRGVYVTGADNDVVDGIRKTASLIGRRIIQVNERCAGTLDSIATYSWDDKAASVGVEKPIKLNDHHTDALRYYVNSLPDWRID